MRIYGLKSILNDTTLFTGVWILLVLGKVINLLEYGFQFTGSDDLVFWAVANDYAQGIFHEPFFYGQNYNFALEAIFAVPLIWLGIPTIYALPIISTFIGVFPFLLFAHVLHKRGHTIPALVFLLIPITLPVEYDLITSMSRGFVTGLFFSSFLIYLILEPKKVSSFFILGVSVSLAFVFNPNSLIFSFPVCLYLLFHNYKNWKFYIIPISIAIPIVLTQEWAKTFYEINPDYKVHFMWTLKYELQILLDAFSNLNQYFRYLTPVFWSGHWVIVLAILVIGIGLIKRNWQKGVSLVLAVLFMLVLLGLNKISDDIGQIFLSSTRMFLAVPLLLGLAFYWMKNAFKHPKEWKLIIATLAISFFLVKAAILPQVVKVHTNISNLGPVGVKKLSDLERECEELKALTQKHDVDLVVFVPQTDEFLPRVEFYSLGCDVINENMTPGVMNIYERRTWIYQEERKTARATVMLFNTHLNNFESIQNQLDMELIDTFPNVVLVRNNDKTLRELCDLFGIRCQRNSYY